MDEFKRSIPRISPKNLLKCIIQSKWFLCHVYQPVCIYTATTNEFTYSPMCQESCLYFKKTKFCIEKLLFNAAFSMKEHCPDRFEHPERFNCSYYPKHTDSNHACQLYEKSKYVIYSAQNHRLNSLKFYERIKHTVKEQRGRKRQGNREREKNTFNELKLCLNFLCLHLDTDVKSRKINKNTSKRWDKKELINITCLCVGAIILMRVITILVVFRYKLWKRLKHAKGNTNKILKVFCQRWL